MFTVPDNDPQFHLFHQDETGVASRLYRLLYGVRIVFRQLDEKTCQEVAQRLYPNNSTNARDLAHRMCILDEHSDIFGPKMTNGLKLALESSDTDVIRYLRAKTFCNAEHALERFPETQQEKLEQDLKTDAVNSKRKPIPEKASLGKRWRSIGSDASDTSSVVQLLPNGGDEEAQANKLKDRQPSANTLRHRSGMK